VKKSQTAHFSLICQLYNNNHLFSPTLRLNVVSASPENGPLSPLRLHPYIRPTASIYMKKRGEEKEDKSKGKMTKGGGGREFSK